MWQLRSCFAAWLAVLIAIIPLTRSHLPAELTALAAFPEAQLAPGEPEDPQPAAGLRPVQPATLGIVSRLSLVEGALGLPPVKPPLLRPLAEQAVPEPGVAAMHGFEPRAVLERSSVGTARTPTGPPA